MFKELDNAGWLDEMMLDMAIHRLKYRTWRNQEAVWRKFIRT